MSIDKRFGMRTELKGFAWKDVVDEIEHDGILIKVHDGMMEVQFDTESVRPKAHQLAKAYLEANAFRTGVKIQADFNHNWENVEGGGVTHSLALASELKLSERLQVRINQATIKGTARIVSVDSHDSASFINDSSLVEKALSDPTLAKALNYYANDVVDADDPLPGIYNAIETITKHLNGDGRASLAKMAAQSKTFVGDLMQATQHSRHPVTTAQLRLSPEECMRRAKVLIQAYADFVGS